MHSASFLLVFAALTFTVKAQSHQLLPRDYSVTIPSPYPSSNECFQVQGGIFCPDGVNPSASTITVYATQCSASSTSTPISSSQTSSPSATSTSLPCYADNLNGQRTFSSASTTSDQMTNVYCKSYCNSRNYAYSGTEYSRECYCSNTAPTVTSSQCTMTCTGATEICGGPNALSVSYNATTAAQNAQIASVASTCTALGCFSDDYPIRVLSGASTTSVAMTSESCINFCQSQGFTLAGTEYSDECYCGNSILTDGSSYGIPASGCTFGCAGNSAEICGGSNRLNVYQMSPSSTSSSSTATSTNSPTSAVVSSATVSTSSGATAMSTASSSAASSASSSSSSASSSSSSMTTTKTSTTSTSSTSSTSNTSVANSSSIVTQTACNGQTYTYQQLAGYGFNPSNATDMYGDTIGGIGSAIALDRTAWTKLANGSYTGVLWTLPDRGWNTQGTYNFQPRVHKFNILFTPQPNATVANPSGPNLQFFYATTILFKGPDGTPTTGLDADGAGHLSYAGFPDLPVATYTGDGFGGMLNGSSHQRIPIDSEGIVLNNDGTFWVSDEYGPYVYKFDASGTMIQAIRPPDAIIPMRNGSESFSADSQYGYINGGAGDDVSPADGPSGRNNNHGFEGLTISGDGTSLYFLLQASANQEGGTSKQTERYTRFLKYDITGSTPVYTSEWVVPLPLYNDPTAKPAKNPKTAAQSEIFHISGGQFFILARDSGAGHGQTNTLSVYRHADIFDVSSATNIMGSTYDCATCAVASQAGVLNSAITPAQYCSFIDYNLNAQLNRFGVHNGGASDQFLLNEKWESLGLVPVDGGSGADGQFYLFSLSDNDFITQSGNLNGGNFHYSDPSGFNLDTQALVFQIGLPTGVNPFVGP